MLDQIQDPFNVGSILRTAECLGAMGVAITKNSTCGVTPAVEKTSAGASAHIPVARVINLTNAIEHAKKAGFWVYGLDANATTNLYSADLAPLSAFVLGGEGSGLRRLVREHCDEILSVPIYGKVTSLNISHTAAIALSEYRRRNNENKSMDSR
jgi:23S rRNA (guanosine2251-2'-O)-methyltransferase